MNMNETTVSRATLLQWLGSLAVAIAVPIILVAVALGQKNQQLEDTLIRIENIQKTNDERATQNTRDLAIIIRDIRSTEDKYQSLEISLERIERKLEEAGKLVVAHDSQISTLKERTKNL